MMITTLIKVACLTGDKEYYGTGYYFRKTFIQSQSNNNVEKNTMLPSLLKHYNIKQNYHNMFGSLSYI